MCNKFGTTQRCAYRYQTVDLDTREALTLHRTTEAAARSRRILERGGRRKVAIYDGAARGFLHDDTRKSWKPPYNL